MKKLFSICAIFLSSLCFSHAETTAGTVGWFNPNTDSIYGFLSFYSVNTQNLYFDVSLKNFYGYMPKSGIEFGYTVNGIEKYKFSDDFWQNETVSTKKLNAGDYVSFYAQNVTDTWVQGLGWVSSSATQVFQNDYYKGYKFSAIITPKIEKGPSGQPLPGVLVTALLGGGVFLGFRKRISKR